MFCIKAGDIRMQLNNRKDYFYAEQVACYESLPDYERLIGIQKVGFDDRNFSTRGTTIEFRETEIDVKDTILSGIYKDLMQLDILVPYQVKIYIRYEMPCEKEIIPQGIQQDKTEKKQTTC
ncbi:MAG: hypothetical protein ACYDEC_09365 [Bacteroidia bacterium]